MSKLNIDRPVQSGDHILITFGSKGGTISFFCINKEDGSYSSIKPRSQRLFNHQYKSRRSGAKRAAALIAFTLGCKIVEIQEWSSKAPPHFIKGKTIVYRLDPVATK